MVTQEQISEVQEKARQMRLHVLTMIGHKDGKVGHLGGSSSSADIVSALYFYKMDITPENFKDVKRDRFLLSKGHAGLIQYAALAEKGFFPKEELKNVKVLGSMLQGHPDVTKTFGVDANTGSLGQGLSIGLGMALGNRLNKCSKKVYVIMGDGEIAEGQIWEAAIAAANFKENKLVGILDRNMVQATDTVDARMKLGDVKAKWISFGWEVIEIDGHDTKAICDALDKADEIEDKPVLILANTIKGKYVSFAEGKSAFHNAALTEEQYNIAKVEFENYICK